MMALTSGAMSSAFALILLSRCLAISLEAVVGTESMNAASDKLMMDRFLRWQGAYNRSYATREEKQHRFEVYRRNMEYIEATNQAGNLAYQLGENHFTDLTPVEFLDRHTTKGTMAPLHDDGHKKASNTSFLEGVAVDAPTSVDWRSQGAVTPIKFQGECRKFLCHVCAYFCYLGVSKQINLVLKSRSVFCC
jgi:KDEL-tailed cysteine endopeptidase